MNNNQTLSPKAVISAILEKEEKGIKYILIQTRWKPKTSPTFTGLLEIPAGAIESYENVYDTLKREVLEETGLKIEAVAGDWQSEVEENIPGNKSRVFKPFICQQVLATRGGLPWIGFVFRVRVSGQPKAQRSEVKNPKWITLTELENIINNQPELIFPLQFPVLKHYLNEMSKQ